MDKIIMNIGLNITQGYLKYAYVLIKSILESNPDEEICFYIFSANLKVRDLDLLNILVESYKGRVELISVDEDLIVNFFGNPHPGYPLGAHTLYFQIHGLPYEHIDRILFLDADMLVRKSLRELYEMDFGDNYVICLDGSCMNEEVNDWPKIYHKFGVTFFSTCCTLYNVTKIKEDFSFNDIVAANKEVLKFFGSFNEELGYALLFNGKERYIPETKYGFYIYPDNEKKYSPEQLLEFEKEAVIIHYWRSHPWASQIGMSPLHLYWWNCAKDTPYYETLKKEFWDFWKDFRSKYLIPR